MELNNQHFEDLYDAMFKLNKLVVAKSSLAASYLIFDFDTSEFLDFNNTYGLSLEDWIKGLDGIRDFLFYNSPENMKIHEYILDEDKALILSYAYKVVLNEIKEISLGECLAIDKYLKLKKEYLWVPDDVDDRFGKFEMQIFEERCNSFFYKIKLGLGYDYESDNDADNSMNSQIKSESNSSVNNKTKTNDKNSTPDYTNSKNLEYRERKMEQSNKEFVHTLSLLTDALNIGTPFAPQLKLNRLIEIEKTFEKLSNKSFFKNLKAFSRNEYEPIYNILDNEKDFNLLKSKVEMEIVKIYKMDEPIFKLLNTLNNKVYSSIELEKVNSNDTNGSTNDNDANESTNDNETLNSIAISATSNNSVSMDSSNIKNNSEPGVWIALLILFVGLFLIYRFAILNSKAITGPINDPVPIEQTIAAESVQFEFMNRLAERKKHGELEYISFIDDGYTDLFKDLNNDEILIGIVSTAGLNFRDNNTMDSNVKLVLNESEKIFIFGECDGWYFGINDVEDANETEYGWCSKYYIEAFVYNFNNKEVVPFKEYKNH